MADREKKKEDVNLKICISQERNSFLDEIKNVFHSF